MQSSALIETIIQSLNDLEGGVVLWKELIENAKPTLLTLHAIFPTILLPALDILDRRLITRLVLHDTSNVTITKDTDVAQTAEHDAYPINCEDKHPAVYYVRSTASDAPASTRGRFTKQTDDDSMSYEVRTTGWNCTCASFTYATFHSGASASDHTSETSLSAGSPVEEPKGFGWGGLLEPDGGNDVPICKHLLACFLAERWNRAGQMVELRQVQQEEMAGWAAGWCE